MDENVPLRGQHGEVLERGGRVVLRVVSVCNAAVPPPVVRPGGVEQLQGAPGLAKEKRLGKLRVMWAKQNLWSYPSYGVPGYGTGWYYPPYWGGYYYPRTPTWGFHVGYNPWTGWNFGVSWGGPFFRVGVTWGGGYGGWGCCGGWYGGGYRHNDININTGDINIGNNINIGNRRNDLGSIRDNRARDNLYNKPANRARNAPQALKENRVQRARSNPKRANDVFADRQGQVAKRTGNDWQVRDKGQWKAPATTQDFRSNDRFQQGVNRAQGMDRSQFQQRPQFDRSHMNMEHRARQRGTNLRRRR